MIMGIREKLEKHRLEPDVELYGFCNAYIEEADEHAAIKGKWESTKSGALLAAFTDEELEERYVRWQIEKES